MKRHYNITIKGKVQGVFFRSSAQAIAQELGVLGSVRNMSNGDVLIEAEGSEAELDQLVEWCWKGPEKALVVELEITEGSLQEYSSFVVTR
jgi:acylphosphatase